MPNAPMKTQPEPRDGASLFAVKVVLLYAVLAALWILLSDQLVSFVFSDPGHITLVSTLKGWLFVAVTSLLLFILLNRFVSRFAPKASEGDLGAMPSGAEPAAGAGMTRPRKLIAIFILLSLFITGIGWGVFHLLSGSMKQRQNHELTALAELKANEIEHWLSERRGDMEVLMSNPVFREALQRRPMDVDPSVWEQARVQLESTRKAYQYVRVELLDLEGHPLAGAGESGTHCAEIHAAVQKAITQTEPFFVDLHRQGENGPICLGFAAAIRDWNSLQDQPLGVAILTIDPYRYLYPMLQTWPGSSSSGEFIIMRREGDEVLFLSDARNRPQTALDLRLPLSNREYPAVQAVLGGPGSYEGPDYRSVPVLTTFRPVAGTTWLLAAKIDQAEVYQGIRRLAATSMVLILTAILVSGMLLVMAWRQQRLQEALARAEQAAEMFALEERFRATFEQAAVGIAMVSPEGQWLKVNQRLCDIVGYPAEELLKLRFQDITHPDDLAADLEATRRMLAGEISTFSREKRYIRKDGSSVWIQPTVALTHYADGQPKFFVSVIEDISERKRAEAALRVSRRFLEIMHNCTDEDSLLNEFLSEIQNYTGCNAVGIRVLDENGGIPYCAYKGFSQNFYDLENTLSIKSDRCMCINVIKGTADPRLPFYTKAGSFYMNGTTRFLATVSEEEKGETRNICNQEGFESVALVPFRDGERIHGLIHIADRRENMVPLEMVETLEKAGMQLGAALKRLRAEEQVRASEANFRLLVESAPDAILVTIDSRIAYLNQAALKLFGASSESQLLGRSVLELIHADFRPLVEERIRILRQDKNPVPPLAEKYLRLDGEPVDVEVNAAPLKYRGKDGALVFARDITESKRAEESLFRSQANIRIAMDLAKLVYWEYDVDKDLFTFDDRFYQLYGTTAGQEGGYQMSPQDYARRFLSPEDQTILSVEMEKALSTKDHNFFRQLEHRIVRRDGQERFIVVRYGVVKDGTGRTIKTFGANQDITGRIQASQEKDKLETQLRQAQKMEAIGTLAGGIAHDFNNILSVIIGNAEILEMSGASSPLVKEGLEQILSASQRAKQLVRQILAFSRSGEQQKLLINLKPVVKETLAFLRASLPTTIQLHHNIKPDAGAIMADPTQMQQILMNLCTNAAHAMEKDGGVLEINLENVEIAEEDARWDPEAEAGAYVKLSVADTGHGMEPWVLERIYDPYFTTKEPGRGTGLGLSVVHGIVKAHGGMIRVYSEVGRGTTFQVFLPRADGVEKVAPQVAQALPRGVEGILFVDDEKALAELAQHMLGWLGYQVETRTSPVEALEAFRVNPGKFDLVITDMTMPQLTGLNLARKLTEIRPGIPIILCTGFSDQANEEKARFIGIRAFLFKPLVMRELAETVRKVIDESAKPPSV